MQNVENSLFWVSWRHIIDQCKNRKHECTDFARSVIVGDFRATFENFQNTTINRLDTSQLVFVVTRTTKLKISSGPIDICCLRRFGGASLTGVAS